jgi:Protein of unknown function (DUF2510)
VTRLEDLPPPKEGRDPGYYPDPLYGKYPRWWDGERWTPRTGPLPQPDLEPGEDRDVRLTPRDASALIGATFRLYGRFPYLFPILAAGVIIPFDVIVLATTGTYQATHAPVAAQIAVTLIGWVLISPLISALHVHAVSDVRQSEEPRIGPVARRGLGALPVVAAATVMSGLGIGLGLLALIVPGILLFFRWAVVAQAAAIDRAGWGEALRSSRRLTAGQYGHIFAVILLAVIITGVVGAPVGLALGDSHVPLAVAVQIVVHVFTASFSALAWALLYFDLVARCDPTR